MELQQTGMIDRLLGIEKALDWHKDNFSIEEINQFLKDPPSQYDFNCFEYPIRNRSGLRKAIMTAKIAKDNIDAPWLMCTCQMCHGNKIILSHREVNWYQASGYELPALCRDCMDELLGGDTNYT